MSKLNLSLPTALLVVAAPFVLYSQPPSPAPTDEPRTQWEYTLIGSDEVPGRGALDRKSRAEIAAYLNGLGEAGWEIVSVDFHDESPGGTSAAVGFVALARRPLHRQR